MDAYRGRERAEWERASEIWAVIAEANRNQERRRQPYTAHHLYVGHNLYERLRLNPPKRGRMMVGSVKAMKGAFIKPRA